MKKILFLFIIGCCVNESFSQETLIQLTHSKTTSLVFPSPIIYIDRGSEEILVNPSKEAGHILFIKAASHLLTNSNLSVVTADGKLYSFPIRYHENPSTMVYTLSSHNTLTTADIAGRIMNNPAGKRIRKVDRNGMLIAFTGIFIRNNVLYFQFEITNCSPIDYDTDLMGFYIKDKTGKRRTARQEQQKQPQHIEGDIKRLPAYERKKMVVAFDKFTIPDNKRFYLEVFEHNGGRHMKLKISNRDILRAKLLD